MLPEVGGPKMSKKIDFFQNLLIVHLNVRAISGEDFDDFSLLKRFGDYSRSRDKNRKKLIFPFKKALYRLYSNFSKEK